MHKLSIEGKTKTRLPCTRAWIPKLAKGCIDAMNKYNTWADGWRTPVNAFGGETARSTTKPRGPCYIPGIGESRGRESHLTRGKCGGVRRAKRSIQMSPC